MSRLTGKGICGTGLVLVITLLFPPPLLPAGGTGKSDQGKTVAHPKTIIGALL